MTTGVRDLSEERADRLVGAEGASRESAGHRKHRLRVGLLYTLLAAIIVYASITTSGFLTVSNAKAILASTGFVGILAVGTSFLMVSGNIFSLSLGTTAAVTGIAFIFLLRYGIVAAIWGAIALGAAICAVQGMVVGVFGANPIVVTIGAGALQTGAIEALTGGAALVPPNGHSSYNFLVAPVAGLPVAVYVLIGLTILGDVMLRRTRIGYRMYFVGDNRLAARAAGMPVARITIYAFAAAGVASAFGGILLGAYNGQASLLLSGTLTYDAIAAVIVGGNAVAGGRGSATRALVGALIIATVGDILLLHGAGLGARTLATGVIVLLFVTIVNSDRLRWRH